MSLEENVETARRTRERGIGGYKIYTYLKGFVPDRDPSKAEEAEVWVGQDIAIARAVHEAVGDSLDLMFYNGRSYNLEQAIRVGKVLDELGYSVFYDPMPAPDGDSLQDYLALQQAVGTPVCAPISGGDVNTRVQWTQKQAVDMNEIDVYAGFTPCLQLVRACQKADVPLDLHGGFPNDIYQFPLYGIVDDEILPWIGLHHWVLQYPVATEFDGSEPGPRRRPWIRRMQARPVDSEGYMHLKYELPGMAVELDWEWIRQHATD
jgi:L-alanine-DL-glutamate epimerase-like enolase superfamily enzyme